MVATLRDEEVAAFQERYQLAFPVLVDTDGTLSAQARLEVWPTKVLLSRESQVWQYWQGSVTK